MAKFVLIDHSLKDIGGHHYEHAIRVLQAAERLGYRPVLAAWWLFRGRKNVDPHWALRPLYRNTTYQFNRVVEKLASLGRREERRTECGESPARGDGLFDALSRWWDRRKIQRWQRKLDHMLDGFARATSALFRREPLAPGDHVFMPTISPTDLPGLLRFFRAEPAARKAHWHLQFHFQIYDGVETDFDCQDGRQAALREVLAGCLAAVPEEMLHFYTTTEHLARQYNRLGITRFHTLPFPIDPALRTATRAARPGQPVRAICLGGLRREKGFGHIPQIVESLWDDYFRAGRIQLIVQAKSAAKLPPALRKLVESPDAARAGKVTLLPWPLSTDAYQRTMLDSDIGLLLYDREEYYARCSGVFVEMLAAGIPVIVAAGCWMADQLAEPIYRHQERLRRALPVVASVARPACAEFSVPRGGTHLFAAIRPIEPTGAGVYVEVASEQRDEAGTTVRRGRDILGARLDGRAVPFLLPIRRGTRRVALRWSNAYSRSPLTAEAIEVAFLSAAGMPGEACARGAVGLVAADAGQVPELLRDMVDHYAHYRGTAAEFSKDWGPLYSPQQVTASLLARAAAAQDALVPAA